MKIASIPEAEIEFSAIRAQGAGGQNVNKVSSAVHLRYSMSNSRFPDELKTLLLALNDHRITKDGVIAIKAQTSRSQEANRLDAMARLLDLINAAAVVVKARRPTKPTYSSKQRRLEGKQLRGSVKALRGKVSY